MRCPQCGEAQSCRVRRRGFLQVVLLPLFGYFPWECASCRFHHLSSKRGFRRQPAGSESEAPSPEQLLADPHD